MKPLAYPTDVQRLANSVLQKPAKSTPQLRREVEAFAAACSGSQRPPADLPEPLRPYLEKVSKHAYKVTNKDIENLKAAGYSEDEIFELTICAALGSGLARLEKTMVLINGGAA